jgi:hypothetical protein
MKSNEDCKVIIQLATFTILQTGMMNAIFGRNKRAETVVQ